MSDELIDLNFPEGFSSEGPIVVKHGKNGATVVILFVDEALDDGAELALEQAATLEKIAASMRNSVATLRAASEAGLS